MKRRPRTRRPSAQLLVLLWCAGLVLLNFPMLIIFDSDATVAGLPLLPVALFAIWAGLIGVLAWAVERRSPRPSDDGEAPGAAGPSEP